MEVHEAPERALSDGANALRLDLAPFGKNYFESTRPQSLIIRFMGGHSCVS